MEYHTNNGTRSWDIANAKLLSVTLVAACLARTGDLAQSGDWSVEETLQWSDIHILVSPNSKNVIGYDITAQVPLRFTKGTKDIADRVIQILPLEPQYQHCCPLAWISVHVLRHGIVADTTIIALLANIAARTDRKIQFLNENRPVLCSFLG